MSAPSVVRMIVLQRLTLAGRQRDVGTVIVLSVDAARHLHHLRRAAPADTAAHLALEGPVPKA